jgi:cell shape-determining protein MreC
MNKTKGMIHTSPAEKLQSLTRVGENTTRVKLILNVQVDILCRINHGFFKRA